MNNICFISSGFQLLNAYEYSKVFNLQFSYYAFFDSENEKKQLLNTADHLNIKKIYLIKRIKILTHIYLLLFFLKSSNNLIIGNLKDNHMLFLTKLFTYKKIILIDDGISTLDSYKYYNSKNYNSFKYPKKLVFFSIFDLGDDSSSIKNNFNFSIDLQKNNSDEVFFIGQPMENILGEDEYYRVLNKIKALNPTLTYIAHRRDSEKKLLFIGEVMGIRILKLNEIIELNLLKSKFLPSKIISFYSTSLITLKLLFKDKIMVNYVFKNEMLNDNLLSIFEKLNIRNEL